MGATQTSTVHTYLGVVHCYIDWLETTKQRHWPGEVAHVVDYCLIQLDMPCSPSFPTHFQQALGWFERLGGRPEERRFAAFSVLVRTVKTTSEKLAVGVEPCKQAPRMLVHVLASLEFFVCDESRPAAWCFHSWVTLAETWGTLDFGDIHNVAPSRMRGWDRSWSQRKNGPTKKQQLKVTERFSHTATMQVLLS